MTTEKAAQWLERYIDNDAYASNFQEACKLAVAALRAQQERENPKPLTLDELRQMDGEPVWDNFLMEWCVIVMDFWKGKGAVKYFGSGFNLLSEKRFYRNKPKEETK